MSPNDLINILFFLFGKANPKKVLPSLSKKEQELLGKLGSKYKESNNENYLLALTKAYLKMLSGENKTAYKRAKIIVSRSSIVPPFIRENVLAKKSSIDFRVQAPPGPARLCRVPFYPLRNTDAWSTRFLNLDTDNPQRQPFGIDEIGDDPILSVGPWLNTANVNSVGPYTLVTRKVEFGAYRLVGMEVCAHYGSRYIGAFSGGTAATGSVTIAGTAVAATGSVVVNIPLGGAGAGTQITLVDTGGTSVTFIAEAPVVSPTGFLFDPASSANTATNFSNAIIASALNITPNVVGTTVNLTQDVVGTEGNTTITSTDAGVFVPTSFTGGVDIVTEGASFTLESTDGTTATFTASLTTTDATNFQIAATSLATLNNINTAIAASTVNGKITPVVADPAINLTQVVSGAGGNNTIIKAGDPTNTLTLAGFAGGASLSFNLQNELSPIAFGLRDLTVYNGNNILVVEDSQSVSATNFNVLNRPETFLYNYQYGTAQVSPDAQAAAPLSQYKREAHYKFIGLRDQPIVDPNSQVFVKVEAFVANVPVSNLGAGYPADTPLPKIPPISFSMNLVVDLLEDKIFGDSVVPSPASRPGANIKLGSTKEGRKLFLTNSTVRKPQI